MAASSSGPTRSDPPSRSASSQSLFAGSRPEPTADAPVEARLAWLLDVQGAACETMGSPLYARLLSSAADDARAGGPVARLLGPHAGAGRSDALALRFMAAVHRLVLTGRAPRLARHYPSAGGTAGSQGAWDELRGLVETEPEILDDLVRLPCQTNEVGRCAGLSWGLLSLTSSGLPLRLLEVGSSAGLLLRWDHYRYGTAGATWGPADSPVDLTGMWAEAPPDGLDAEVTVIERRGCDPSPVDPTTDEGRLALRSSVWPDQQARFDRLEGALGVASRVAALVDPAPVEEWLPGRLAEHHPGTATVVFHSVVEEYLDVDARASLHAALANAGARARADAPLAWLRLEPITELRQHGIRLTTWSGDAATDGVERWLAVCGAHGHDVRRPPV